MTALHAFGILALMSSLTLLIPQLFNYAFTLAEGLDIFQCFLMCSEFVCTVVRNLNFTEVDLLANQRGNVNHIGFVLHLTVHVGWESNAKSKSSC